MGALIGFTLFIILAGTFTELILWMPATSSGGYGVSSNYALYSPFKLHQHTKMNWPACFILSGIWSICSPIFAISKFIYWLCHI